MLALERYGCNWALPAGPLFRPETARPVSGCTIGDRGSERRKVGDFRRSAFWAESRRSAPGGSGLPSG